MSADYFPVFLYRWDDENEVRDASTVSFGEKRQIRQHHSSTVIGVATRPVGEPIEFFQSSPEFEDQTEREFREHVHDQADDVRWFDKPLKYNSDSRSEKVNTKKSGGDA